MQTLDVAIGMIFVILMLSLAVTAFNELWTVIFKRRSNTLWRGVLVMLKSEDLAKKLYAHPLISSLSQSSTGKPVYIPARTFVMSLLDLLTPPGSPPPVTKQEVLAGLDSLPADQKEAIATAMVVLLHDAGDDIELFKKNLVEWFDNSMERVSGWYKRQTQTILMSFAIGLTIWTNADMLAIGNTLWRDPSVRAALVAQAQQYAEAQKKDVEPAAQASSGGPAPPPVLPPAEAPDIAVAADNFQKSLHQIQEIAIPLGWRDGNTENDRRDPVPTTFAMAIAALQSHGIGWLLTALAISLGAPFWFDMLNKVIAIRSSGRAPEEKPKDPNAVPAQVPPAPPPAPAPAP